MILKKPPPTVEPPRADIDGGSRASDEFGATISGRLLRIGMRELKSPNPQISRIPEFTEFPNPPPLKRHIGQILVHARLFGDGVFVTIGHEVGIGEVELIVFEVAKSGETVCEFELYGFQGTISVLGDDDLGHTFHRIAVLILQNLVILRSVDEGYNVCILLDRS